MSTLGPRARILYAEDDPLVGDMYKFKLELEGYEVTWVADGEQALHLLRAGGYDVAILDMRLPKMDGLTILARAREEDLLAETAAIVLSAYGEAEMLRQAEELGARWVMKNKVGPAELAQQLPEILGRRGRER